MQAVSESLQRADWMGAAGLAESALEAGDHGPLLFKLRALRRQQAGQWARAAEDIQRALAEWPDDVSAWNMLGFCQARAGAPDAALAALDKAIALSPDFAPAWVNRGWALEMTGELKAAAQAYEKARTLDPDDARPASSLALLAARVGDWTRAHGLAAQVLLRDPHQSAAGLALAVVELGKDHPAAALTRRDPRDVVLSCFRQRFVIGPSTAQFLTLDGAALFFDRVMTLAETYVAGLTELALHVQSHEALVDDFEGQTRALLGFVGLSWDPAVAGFADRVGSSGVATPSAGQIARGLNREGMGQWRRYAEALAPVQPLLGPWVERFGYAPT